MSPQKPNTTTQQENTHQLLCGGSLVHVQVGPANQKLFGEPDA